MNTISRSIGKASIWMCLVFSLMMFVPSTPARAQEIDDVTEAVDDVSDDVIALGKSILRIALVVMLVFFILNYAFNFTNQRNVVLTLVVVLILYGVFAAITGSL